MAIKLQPTIATVLSVNKLNTHMCKVMLAMGDDVVWFTLFGQLAFQVGNCNKGAKIFLERPELTIVDNKYYNFESSYGQLIKDGKANEEK